MTCQPLPWLHFELLSMWIVRTLLLARDFLVVMEYPCYGDAMENVIQSQIENSAHQDSLFLASLILLDVRRILMNVQMMVAILLSCAAVSLAIANNLIGMVLATASEED